MTMDLKQDALAMNFGWILEGGLAACRGPRSERDLACLTSQGIQALVRLAWQKELGLTSGRVRGMGLEDFYEPVHDFTAPTQNQIDRVVRFVRGALDGKKAVAVSCGAGYGRTGTILACYLVSAGRTADDAIRHVVSIRPGCKEILDNPGQKQAVVEFERRLKAGEVLL